jgi:hypothetical protein
LAVCALDFDDIQPELQPTTTTQTTTTTTTETTTTANEFQNELENNSREVVPSVVESPLQDAPTTTTKRPDPETTATTTTTKASETTTTTKASETTTTREVDASGSAFDAFAISEAGQKGTENLDLPVEDVVNCNCLHIQFTPSLFRLLDQVFREHLLTYEVRMAQLFRQKDATEAEIQKFASSLSFDEFFNDDK